ncbi:MAG: Periplasmic AppA protein [Luteibacter sp.]|uniref:histidine-type phosphatase n=1 Tax=Luteibacter sp. TaxID=1886636 RepID=UPI0013844EE1|nr:histidine-type phosphatase [Luteibacter sp.]KAF1007303.1 MAG: Periplasmic AppA protein [Luteibacter sp.]
MRAALLLLALGVATAAHAGDVVRAEVVLIRHGVRSPTKPAETYAAYARGTWPAWSVAPGMLTAHGKDGMRAIGARWRTELVADGALASACPDADRVVVIGDSTPRNRESSEAFSEGLAPGCHLGYLATAGDENNALFHYRKDDDDDAPSTSAQAHAALTALQSLLLDCGALDCASVAKKDGKKLLPEAPAEAMKLAGTLSENLMLAYAEGLPMSAVAFGRGDRSTLERLILLHNAQFAAGKKAMPAAARAGSNLAAHILGTLQAAAGDKPSVAPLLATGRGVVVLVGHDTNLANIAGVFGLDWHDAARPDDYSPGGALSFTLVERDGHPFVLVRQLMPSMDDLRANRYEGMKRGPVHVAGCPTMGECPLDTLVTEARKRLDANRIDNALPSMAKQASMP